MIKATARTCRITCFETDRTDIHFTNKVLGSIRLMYCNGIGSMYLTAYIKRDLFTYGPNSIGLSVHIHNRLFSSPYDEGPLTAPRNYQRLWFHTPYVCDMEKTNSTLHFLNKNTFHFRVVGACIKLCHWINESIASPRICCWCSKLIAIYNFSWKNGWNGWLNYSRPQPSVVYEKDYFSMHMIVCVEI